MMELYKLFIFGMILSNKTDTFDLDMTKKQTILFLFLSVGVFGLESCSKCYECSEQVLVEDANGVVIDTVETTETLCTANSDEIEQRERNGAICR